MSLCQLKQRYFLYTKVVVNFGKTLRELRIDRGMTQNRLAEKLNVSPTSIRDWENRNKQPNYDMLYNLSKIFDVTIGQLLGVEEL